jgi:hypothetical protein
MTNDELSDEKWLDYVFPFVITWTMLMLALTIT